MQKRVGWLWVVGVFGVSAGAIAQTPAVSTADTRFDGTYAFVSSAKVNETYATMRTEHIMRCPDRKAARPLVIVNSRARLLRYEGTVGPRGELLMRNAPGSVKFGTLPGTEITISGGIDDTGKVRARQTGWSCQYDWVWQKLSK